MQDWGRYGFSKQARSGPVEPTHAQEQEPPVERRSWPRRWRPNPVTEARGHEHMFMSCPDAERSQFTNPVFSSTESFNGSVEENMADRAAGSSAPASPRPRDPISSEGSLHTSRRLRGASTSTLLQTVDGAGGA